MSGRSGALDHRAIERRAAAWLARRDGGEWTSQDEKALEAWLNESTAYRVAFLRLESVWEEARRARALGAGRPAGFVPSPGELSQSPFFKTNKPRAARTGPIFQRRIRWAAAAVLLLVLGIGTATRVLHWLRPGNEYSTPLGVIASAQLPDGSIVTLNTASRIRVEFDPKERRVILERGEAYFEVKKNPARPFAVLVGDQRIVDIGTHFSVMREPSGLRVVVTEGEVEFQSLRGLTPDSSWTNPVLVAPGLAAINVPLVAGTVALAHDGDLLVHKLPISQVNAMVSWREGYLSFHDTTLADAVAEFNRYSVRHITIKDPRVAGIRISGTFLPTNCDAFVRLLHDGYSVDVHDTKAGIFLTGH